MKVKVSKTVAKELLKAAKKQDFTSIQNIIVDALPPTEYEHFVNYDLFNALDYGDFDAAHGVIKFLRVIYKEECYSLDRFFTTYDLLKEFNNSDHTLAGFTKNVLSLLEI